MEVCKINVFEFRDVSFAYSDYPVFTHLNLKIAVGDFVAVVGENGSGKSTLLKLCVGALKPHSGQVRIFNQPIASYQGWHKIGYVPQNPLKDRSFPITVEEIVAMGRVAGLGIGHRLKQADREIITHAIQVVGIGAIRSQLIGHLSGGQQQRVMVARALAAEPEVLIMDEPTAGVDAKGSEELYSLLQCLNKESGITILLVSHDVDRVANYANTVASIDQGLKYYGTAKRFPTAPIR